MLLLVVSLSLADNKIPAMVAEATQALMKDSERRLKMVRPHEDCEAFCKAKGEPQQRSGRAEEYEMIMNHYC